MLGRRGDVRGRTAQGLEEQTGASLSRRHYLDVDPPASCCPMVVSQQTTQTLATADFAISLADATLRPDQLIPEALMIPLCLIMNHELLNRTS